MGEPELLPNANDLPGDRFKEDEVVSVVLSDLRVHKVVPANQVGMALGGSSSILDAMRTTDRTNQERLSERVFLSLYNSVTWAGGSVCQPPLAQEELDPRRRPRTRARSLARNPTHAHLS